MDAVHSDLKKYLLKNIFPSRTVLVFPPFNGFRRFLIHKLIEDNFASLEVAAFSIGQDTERRIVVCYKGLIRKEQLKSVPVLPQNSQLSMIEKETLPRLRSTPTAAVYRPPAIRLAETRRSTDEVRTSETKRVRRPDQQVYVPRPKRASYGSDLPRSRSHSSSRTSLDSDSCNEKVNNFTNKVEGRGSSEVKLEINLEDSTSTSLSQHNVYKEEASCSKEPMKSSAQVDSQFLEEDRKLTPSTIDSTESSIISVGNEASFSIINSAVETSALKETDYPEKGCEECLKSQSSGKLDVALAKMNPLLSLSKSKSVVAEHVEDSLSNGSINKTETSSLSECHIPKEEAMETISISSDSRDNHINNLTSSSSDSRESDSSSESEAVKKSTENFASDQMEIENSSKVNGNRKKDCESDECEPQDKNKKNRRIFPNVPVSDVLIITDTSSSSDGFKIASDREPTKEVRKEKVKKQVRSKSSKIDKSAKRDKVDPGSCDWESLYDDSGECLVPDLMEELTNSVGRVRVTSTESDYREFQTIEERTSDGECVIEIYDFPAEFKTSDLINIFAPYRNKNFQIKWVDDTHALGVFPSPLMADEVLACTLPFVKTRPLRLGIAESRLKARNLVLPVLPPMERPKTCTALARRLVSGALGLRLPTSSQEREKERQVLKEAREKRRLEAKQREAAWDGTISSESCI